MTNAKNGRPVVAVTFDDGFQNNYDIAFPVLKKWGIPATIFLATAFIGSNNTVWFCRINEALSKTSLTYVEWEGMKFDLSSRSARANAHSAIQTQLKRYAHPQLLEKVSHLIEMLACRTDEPMPAKSPYRMLGTREIWEMSRSGLVDFGAHTCSHAILSGLSLADRKREIADSLADVERLTGHPCTLFAYPNGGANDYAPCDVEALREKNVNVAVTTIGGPNDQTAPSLELRRYGIGDDTSMAYFKLLTHHVLWKLRK